MIEALHTKQKKYQICAMNAECFEASCNSGTLRGSIDFQRLPIPLCNETLKCSHL